MAAPPLYNHLSIDKLVNLDRLKMTKCVRYCKAEIGLVYIYEYERFLLVGTSSTSTTSQYQGSRKLPLIPFLDLTVSLQTT